jgi:hypothetical protein
MQKGDTVGRVQSSAKRTPLADDALAQMLVREYGDVLLEEADDGKAFVVRSRLSTEVDERKHLVVDFSTHVHLRVKRLHLLLGAAGMTLLGVGLQYGVERFLR